MLNNIDTNISQYAIIFVILSYINHKSYDIVENLLIKKSNKYNTLSENRKLYVQKNFVKSCFIFIFSIYATYALYLPIVYNKWDNFTLHILGLFYSINDIVSLIKVKKLPFTTKLHHIAVTILSLQKFWGKRDVFEVDSGETQKLSPADSTMLLMSDHFVAVYSAENWAFLWLSTNRKRCA